MYDSFVNTDSGIKKDVENELRWDPDIESGCCMSVIDVSTSMRRQLWVRLLFEDMQFCW